MNDPARLVADLAKAHIAARCLHVAARYGVADAVGPEPLPASVIAARCGVDADALERILRLLAAHGVFAEQAGGYAHNAASELLRSDHPRSLRSYVRMTGMPSFWDRFTELPKVVETGARSTDWQGLLAYFSAHPDEAAFFDEAMIAKSRAVLPAVSEAYDFTPFATIADVGGGRGHLLSAVLERAPRSAGLLFELPQVLAQLGSVGPRITPVPGDFFVDALPRAELYLLMDLLHDWTDADAARILAGVRRAATPGARVLIVETLVPETPGPHFGKTLDIIMLAVTGGRERTEAEHRSLLAAAGFRLERVLPTRSEYSLVEAVAV